MADDKKQPPKSTPAPVPRKNENLSNSGKTQMIRAKDSLAPSNTKPSKGEPKGR